MLSQESSIFPLPYTVNVLTYKTNTYKVYWIKNGKCSDSEPENFNIKTDKIYIVAELTTQGKKAFLKEYCINWDTITPLSNSLENLSRDILNKHYSEQISLIIQWCQEFGVPFFGNNGLVPGDVQTCYKATKHIGFNFSCFIDDLMRIHKGWRLNSQLLSLAALHKKEHFSTADYDSALEIAVYFDNLISFICYARGSIYTLESIFTKQCKQCGKVFVSSNPKKEYCDKHTPQSYYAMKKRLKNK